MAVVLVLVLVLAGWEELGVEADWALELARRGSPAPRLFHTRTFQTCMGK